VLDRKAINHEITSCYSQVISWRFSWFQF